MKVSSSTVRFLYMLH